ncbi:MAG: hypothetical protein RL375_661, partial [Pseudomonadota bacterium]
MSAMVTRLQRFVRTRPWTRSLGAGLSLALASWLALLAMPSDAQRVADVRSTLHNLSASGPGTTRASAGGTDEVCVFCHTPHGASQQDQGGGALRSPLW